MIKKATGRPYSRNPQDLATHVIILSFGRNCLPGYVSRQATETVASKEKKHMSCDTEEYGVDLSVKCLTKTNVYPRLQCRPRTVTG